MQDLTHIFKAYDIRGKVTGELTPEFVHRVGQVFAMWLPTEGPVVVGHDMRPDSEALANAVIQGLSLQGREVWDIGLATSDMVYFSPAKFSLAGGVMITASHNPGEYNGIKFCREGALPVGLVSGLDQIRDKVLSDASFSAAATPGRIIKKDIKQDWIDQLLGLIDVTKIKPFHIAVDAGNGMTGMTFPWLAEKLPLKIEQMYFDLDGTFPNHEANPMKTETLAAIGALIRDKKLDFGIAFDGDGDRMALIDEKGEPVSGSMTALLLAMYVLKKHPKAVVVHDLRMSHATLDYITAQGGTAIRTKVGNTILKEVGRQENAELGLEITGHFMFKDNYFVDSAQLAALIALQVLSEITVPLSEFVAQYDAYAHKPEINLETTDAAAAMKALEAGMQADGATTDWLDGLTATFEYGWINVRPSNTEPVMRLNAEAKTSEQLEALIQRAIELAK